MATPSEIRNAILDDLSSKDETMTAVELSRIEARLVIETWYQEDYCEDEDQPASSRSLFWL